MGNACSNSKSTVNQVEEPETRVSPMNDELRAQTPTQYTTFHPMGAMGPIDASGHVVKKIINGVTVTTSTKVNNPGRWLYKVAMEFVVQSDHGLKVTIVIQGRNSIPKDAEIQYGSGQFDKYPIPVEWNPLFIITSPRDDEVCIEIRHRAMVTICKSKRRDLKVTAIPLPSAIFQRALAVTNKEIECSAGDASGDGSNNCQ